MNRATIFKIIEEKVVYLTQCLYLGLRNCLNSSLRFVPHRQNADAMQMDLFFFQAPLARRSFMFLAIFFPIS